MENALSKTAGNETLQNIGKLVRLFGLCRMSMWGLAGSLGLSLCTMVVTMYSVLLLFPFVEGIIKSDFNAVRSMKGFSVVIACWPEHFRADASLFLLLVVWLYVVTAVKNILQYSLLRSLQAQTISATIRLRQLLIEKCFSLGKTFYDEHATSYVQGILTQSAYLVESQIQSIQQSAGQVFLLGGYLAIMFCISWKLTLIAFLVFPLAAFLVNHLARTIRQVIRMHHQAFIDFNAKAMDALFCMPMIKSFVKEKDAIRSLACASEFEIRQRFRAQHLIGLSSPVEDMTATTAILCIAVGLAVIMRTDHAVPASQAIMFLYLLIRLNQNLNVFSRFYLSIARASAPLRDIEAILYQGPHAVVAGGAEPFPGIHERIEFKGVSFSYKETGPLILDGVRFTVEKGSIVAIVGPSGSGKSTLVHLLLRFYDCGPGEIRVDGIDIRDYDISSLRKRMSFVSQTTFLFNDTIRNNITYGISGDVTDDAIYKMGVQMRIHDFVDRLPDRYETKVGERGSLLSGGECQRLAITRAMMRDAEILIMDEATSLLDSHMEEAINEHIYQATRQKTVIIVAHRLSTIKRADKIIYLEKGRVAEEGTLRELLDRKGLFFRQWELQRL